jgi:hypothetical protein
VSGAEQALATLRHFMRRVTHWEEGKPDKHDAMAALGEAQDATEWAEKGVVEWRSEALRFKGLHHDCATQLRVALRERDEARAQLVADLACPTCGEDGGTSCGAPNCGLLA